MLTVVDNCLCLKSAKIQYRDKPRVILPTQSIDAVCGVFHVNNRERHRDRFRTELQIRKGFWRPGLKRMVTKYVNTCSTCNHVTTAGTKGEPPQYSDKPSDTSLPDKVTEGVMEISLKEPFTAEVKSMVCKVDTPCYNLPELKIKFLERARIAKERYSRRGCV